MISVLANQNAAAWVVITPKRPKANSIHTAAWHNWTRTPARNIVQKVVYSLIHFPASFICLWPSCHFDLGGGSRHGLELFLEQTEFLHRPGWYIGGVDLPANWPGIRRVYSLLFIIYRERPTHTHTLVLSWRCVVLSHKPLLCNEGTKSAAWHLGDNYCSGKRHLDAH